MRDKPELSELQSDGFSLSKPVKECRIRLNYIDKRLENTAIF